MFYRLYEGLSNFYFNVFTDGIFKKMPPPNEVNQRNFAIHIAQLKSLITTSQVDVVRRREHHPFAPGWSLSHDDSWLKYAMKQLTEYDNKSFFTRCWLRITGQARDIAFTRLWLATEVCKPYLNCQNLGESTFSIPEAYLKVFPSAFKKIISRLVFDTLSWQSNMKIENRNIEYSTTLGEYRTLSHEEVRNKWDNYFITSIKDIIKAEDYIATCSIYSKVEQIETTKKLSEYKMRRLVYACGYLNLPLENMTTRKLLAELRSIYLKIHPDKVKKSINIDGKVEHHTIETIDILTDTTSSLFQDISRIFKDITANDEIIVPSLLIGPEAIRNMHAMGSRAGKIFNQNVLLVTVTFPQTVAKLAIANRSINRLHLKIFERNNERISEDEKKYIEEEKFKMKRSQSMPLFFSQPKKSPGQIWYETRKGRLTLPGF
ncbi:MAG: hypothetical protein V4501_02990 [Pseudomonadota bacterium]